MYQDSLLIALICVIVALIIYLVKLYNDKKEVEKSNKGLFEKLDKLDQKLELRNKEILDLTQNINSKALVLFNKFKSDEIKSITNEIRKLEIQNANLELKKWIKENEDRIRKDSSERSKNIILGQLYENLTPFLKGFKWNPKDVRFLGHPVDLIVFDGISEGRERIKVHFVEIKTGQSNLSKRQRIIRDAILDKEVYWSTHRPDKELEVTYLPEKESKLKSGNIDSILNMYPYEFTEAMKNYISAWRKLNPITSYDDWLSNLDEEIIQEVDEEFLNCIWFASKTSNAQNTG